MNIFKICPVCGSLIEVINNDSDSLTCCGNKMKELTVNTTDASLEKHIPVVEMTGRIANVKVGSTLHPMEENHYIAWIYVKTNLRNCRFDLKPGDEPVALIELQEDEEILNAYAYCNLHSLWGTSK